MPTKKEKGKIIIFCASFLLTSFEDIFDHNLQIKGHKEVAKWYKSRVSYYFLLDDGRIRIWTRIRIGISG
jgi:hypothetical protein